ncbi:MAG: hypothetical protein J6Q38_03890 [Clostridia bacterium]|nr:hypothetical protein [Clostridia bacterium]
MTKKKKITAIILAIVFVVIVVFGCVLFIKIIPDIKTQREWDEYVKNYYAQKISTYEQENALYEDYEVDVAFLGDSLTDGYDLQKYFPEYKTSNRGIGGDTTVGLESRLKVSVYDLKPKVAVMLIGANNMDSMFGNYENILIGLRDNLPNTKIVLLSLTAMGGELWGRKNQLAAYNNVKIKKLASEYGFTFVDLYTPLFNPRTGEVYDGLTVDGGHFTHEGYVVVTAQIKPVLENLLN